VLVASAMVSGRARCGLLVVVELPLRQRILEALGPAARDTEVAASKAAALARLSAAPSPAWVLLDADMEGAGPILEAVAAAQAHVAMGVIVVTSGGRMLARARFADPRSPTFEPFPLRQLANELQRLEAG
jgi:CheY-like chemotaxis protein